MHARNRTTGSQIVGFRVKAVSTPKADCVIRIAPRQAGEETPRHAR